MRNSQIWSFLNNFSFLYLFLPTQRIRHAVLITGHLPVSSTITSECSGGSFISTRFQSTALSDALLCLKSVLIFTASVLRIRLGWNSFRTRTDFRRPLLPFWLRTKNERLTVAFLPSRNALISAVGSDPHQLALCSVPSRRKHQPVIDSFVWKELGLRFLLEIFLTWLEQPLLLLIAFLP